MNKFEQVPSDGSPDINSRGDWDWRSTVSGAKAEGSHVPCLRVGAGAGDPMSGRGLYVRSKASRIMITWRPHLPLNGMTDRHL